ncbi:hypothetical protein [Sediminicola sp. 1XM1-17]|uniref:hypothetical protein n=1 Tax=Sediminicola sp. 1XM1-17 TaxID=3127702 RepID=UPI003077605A
MNTRSLHAHILKSGSILLLVFMVNLPILAQNTINYNNATRPSSDAAMEAAANMMTRRNPSNDFLFNNVRNSEVAVDWKNAIGSPYMNDRFSLGSLYSNGEQIAQFYYRYNAYNDEIELKESLSETQISSLVKDVQFSLKDGSNTYTYHTMVSKKNEHSKGYLNLLVEGDRYSLLRKDLVKFKKGAPAPNSMVKPTPDKFTNFTEYYYVDKNTPGSYALFLDRNLKSFMASLKKSEKERLKSIIKVQKLNTKKEVDLVSLFKLLNQQY